MYDHYTLYQEHITCIMYSCLYDIILYMHVFGVYQVGPQVLVLGEKAQKHGLATSLLQRMHGHYKSNASSTEHLTC